ncbi:MAG: CHRD domain-containing protein, partial [Caldilineae bacterium]
GYGQASGTSMASPHVAGAAAVLKQKYPTWTPAQIKSALMSTSKYMDIYNFDGSPAQPIDMGAGRLDLGAAMDPGVILDPPKADFGLVISSTARAKMDRVIQVTNVGSAAETYNISTLFTGNGFAPTQTTTLKGVTVSPTSLTLNPGETKSVTVSFDPAAGVDLDINQGYIVMKGSQHEAHMPFFARVISMDTTADVLLIDVDFSTALGLPDYTAYYTRTLENLGVSYAYWDADMFVGAADSFTPDFPTLKKFKTVLIYTGDNFYPDGFFTVPTPLTAKDMDRLTEYANAGGRIIVMGQDAASVLNSTGSNPPFFYEAILGAEYLQDSVSGNVLPPDPIVPVANNIPAFADLWLDLTGPNEALGKVPMTPVAGSVISDASVTFAYSNFTMELSYQVEIQVSGTLTLTNAHIHSGTVGVSGPVVHPTWPFTESQVVTDTISWSGAVKLTPEQEQQRQAGGLYLNVHSSVNPAGEARAQVPSTPVIGDGAANQAYIDELKNPRSEPSPSNAPYEVAQYAPLLRFPGPFNQADGVVAVGHRDQPTLERSGIAYLGRSAYTSFGLEGVNNNGFASSREDLLGTLLNYVNDEPTATISHTAEVTTSQMSMFQVNVSSNITDGTVSLWKVRWDWGDGSGYTDTYYTQWAQHQYVECGDYTVRAEVTDSYGNTAMASQNVTITACKPAVVTTIGSSGGELRSDSGDVELNIPAGVVDDNTTVAIAEVAAPKQETGILQFLGKGVEITAKDAQGNPITQFNQPFSLIVKYEDSDWQNAGIPSEDNVNVYFWDGSIWQAMFPCKDCVHDQVNNFFDLKV